MSKTQNTPSDPDAELARLKRLEHESARLVNAVHNYFTAKQRYGDGSAFDDMMRDAKDNVVAAMITPAKFASKKEGK